MGMFDRLYVRCPNCNAQIELQSKAGECQLNTYGLHDVDVRVALDLRKEVQVCQTCLRTFRIVVRMKVTAEKIKDYDDNFREV